MSAPEPGGSRRHRSLFFRYWCAGCGKLRALFCPDCGQCIGCCRKGDRCDGSRPRPVVRGGLRRNIQPNKLLDLTRHPFVHIPDLSKRRPDKARNPIPPPSGGRRQIFTERQRRSTYTETLTPEATGDHARNLARGDQPPDPPVQIRDGLSQVLQHAHPNTATRSRAARPPA